MAELNEQVLRYQATGQGLQELLSLLSARVYAYPRLRGSRCEDDAGEFYLLCYPRLVRTLQRFREQGKPFEWYLQSVLRWQYLAFVRARRRRERQWASGSLAAFWEPPPLEPEPGLDPPGLRRQAEGLFRLEAGGRRVRRAERTRLLVWALKRVRVLSEEEVQELAELSGFSPELLGQACARLRQALLPHERRLELLAGRRTRAYAALCLLEQELAREAEPARREALERRVQKARRALGRSQRRIAAVRLAPSNREIAAALGLPKGTVDSALYSLRRRRQAGAEAA
jgi:DNA-directed RNA polymerase specialized sigma24 family protein